MNDQVPIEDQSVLDYNFDDVYDFQFPVEDQEYSFVVRAVDRRNSQKKQEPMLNIRLEITGDGSSAFDDLYHIIMLPKPGDDPKQKNKSLRRVQEFYRCIGVDSSAPVAVSSLVGLTGNFTTCVRPDQNGHERVQVKAFLIPS